MAIVNKKFGGPRRHLGQQIYLASAMELYEEGVKLSKMADEIISKAEVRVKRLSEK